MLGYGRLVLAWLVMALAVAEFSPEIKSTAFQSEVNMRFIGTDGIVAIGDESAYSGDNGALWNPIAPFKKHEVKDVVVNPYFKERAVAIMVGAEHFATRDGGKTWQKFTVPGRDKKPLKEWDAFEVQFNSALADLVEIEFMTCTLEKCLWRAVASKDGLKTVKALPEGFVRCVFPRSSADFVEVKPETLVCLSEETNSFGDVVRTSLRKSVDLFEKSETIDFPGLKDRVILDIQVKSSFFLVNSLSDKFTKDSKVQMVVSKDLESFSVANRDFQFRHNYLLVIHASPAGIVISEYPRGILGGADLYVTDSTGLKVSPVGESGLDSVIVSPAVGSIWSAALHQQSSVLTVPKRRTQITHDSGSTWQKLEVNDDPDCQLSAGCSFQPDFLDLLNTPNIFFANGVKGQVYSPNDYDKSDLYVSRDGGVSWDFSLKGRFATAILDQGNVIVGAREGSLFPLKEVVFSLDQGKTWSTLKLDEPIAEAFLFKRPDSSGTRVFISGALESGYVVTSLDFKNAQNGVVCTDNDLETVPASTPEGAEAFCFNGHQDTFTRRKQDAKCLISNSNELVKIAHDECECTAFDYECSPYFELSPKQVCVPSVAKIAEVCGKQKKVKLPLHQKIAGNSCVLKNKKDSDFIHEVEFNCKDIQKEHKTDATKPKISVEATKLGGAMAQYSYVKSTNGSDNILLLTNDKNMFASNNGGQSFVQVPLPDDVLFFMVGAYESTAIIVTEKHLYYSENGGNTFQQVVAPEKPNTRGLPIVFDPSDPKKFIFIANDATTGGLSGSQAYYTEDAGLTFKKLLDNVLTCGYVDDSLGVKENLLYCTVVDGQKRKLVSSKNYFRDTTEIFDNVLAFALKPGFVFVALVVDGSRNLRAKVTVDGVTFADADFPNDFHLDQQTAYTILDSASHSLLMHVTTDRTRGQERGALLKSNSNGTSYVLALEDVNRNTFGFVDFDRIDILEGTYIANTVYERKMGKKLKTRISHNDGGLWEYLAPPAVDSAGKAYGCKPNGKNPYEKCSLNLRSFTERPDYKDTFSSTSAVGYLFGVGNVGETLNNKDLATFMSSDGGVTWKEVVKGAYMWEYGDRGTILVLVKEKDLTQEIMYSTDDAKTWQTFQFSDKPVRVLDLATVPADTSRKFIILGESAEAKGQTLVFSLDFTYFFPRQCQLDLDHPLDDDYVYWTPKLPGSKDSCIFGHVSQYLRRAEGHYDCFIGAAPLENGVVRTQNCPCTVKDYECDYNFYRDTDGTCKLVKGLSPQDHKKQMCSKPDTFQYFEPTGYRKLPSSTCVGGKELDSFDPQACPGHEKEFNEKYGRNINFGKLLVLLVVPLGAFFGATWFVYERGVKRNGGIQRLGQIRLDDANDFDPIEDNDVDKVVNGIVRGGIFLVAGTIATFKTLRKMDRKMFENITGLLFGRRPGRRNYVRVPDDEDELFGDYDDNYNDEENVDFHVDDAAEDLEDFAPQEADANLFDIDDENAADEDSDTKAGALR